MMQGSLARRLRILRAERGLTLREAASLTGVAKETISDIERNLRHPHDPTLAKIAKGYNMPIEELIGEPVAARKADAPQADRGAGRGALNDWTGHARTLNEMLYRMQQAYAPGRELDWSRQTLEEISALVAKAAIGAASTDLDVGGLDAHVEVVQLIGRAAQVVRFLDERAADAPNKTTGPPPDNVVQLGRELRQFARQQQQRAV